MKLDTSVGLLGCFLLVQSGRAAPNGPPARTAEEAANPYAVISERNIFHLNPIPPPPPAEETKADLPVVKLSGFFEVGHKVRALLSSLPKKAKEGPTYYDLAEGEKSKEVEVVKIRLKEETVDILNSGTAMTLSLKDDSLAGAEQAPAKTKAHREPPAGFTRHKGGGPYQQPAGFSGRPMTAAGFPYGARADKGVTSAAGPRRIPVQ